MATPSSPRLAVTRPNRTVLTAYWVLGIIALIELVAASMALAPRLFTTSRPPAAQPVAELAPTTTPPQPAVEQVTPPQKQPTKASPSRGEIVAGADASTSGNPAHAGAVLGIVNARLEGLDEGAKRLQITIKASPREQVDVPQVKVQVYFYDDQDGEIIPSKAQVTSTWASPPVDWKEGEPELLDVRYLPESADPAVRFAGYVVAVYYKGDLQDYRAEPARLTRLFPLKYFIGLDE